MTCPGCGFAVAPDFAFCPKCGTKLGAVPVAPPPAPAPAPASAPAPAAVDADRRPVSVLFADVAGFTTLGEQLDPEDVRAFQDDLFQELRGAIEQHGGFVEKFVGDAVMATFGAPVAHEDDPERALRAALALHDAMTEVNRVWERQLGRRLALHVGVNTGPVVAGTLGAAADGAYAVTGDTVNTAARLQSAAAPGQTLVGRATYLRTQHAFAFGPVEEVRLKGKAELVPAFSLLRALETPGSARGLRTLGLTAPLVGREAELGRMLAAFERVAGGRAEVVSLVGEAGIGKSRLLDELLARLAEEGRLEHATLRRAAGSSTGEPTYGVLAAFFREGYGLAASDPPDVVRRKLAAGLEAMGAGEEERARLVALAGHVLDLPPDPSAARLDPEQIGRQILLGIRLVFERRLARGPLVLVVEDAHWADAASIELLCAMADRLADRPLLVVFASRPDPALAALATGRATHTVIHLDPLSASDGQALLGALFDASAGELPAGLGELLARRAGGNPFYLEELVRELIADGVLVHEGGRWTFRGGAAAADVPLTVQGLILSRLDRLPASARRIAQEAAIQGAEFDRRVLERVAGDAAACESALAHLREAGLVREVPGGEPGRYAYTHALFQEAIYQNVLLRRRTELHGRVGQALEALGGTRAEDWEQLGHHFSLSADRARGARYLVQAGDRARSIFANADAIRHYERALGILAESEAAEGERSTVQERLADVLGLTGRRDAARRHYDAVRRSAEAAGDRPAEARVCRKLAALHWDAGEREPALGWLRTGLSRLDGVEHIEVAHLYQEMGRMAFRSGDNAAALEWADRALARAEGLSGGQGPERGAAIAHAHNTRGVALARLGRLDEAVLHIERSVEIAAAHDLLQVACRGYANLGVLYSTLNPGRAVETCRSGLEIAQRIGDLGFQSRLYANLAVAYCALTNRCDDDGIAAARTAIELDRQLGQLDHLAVPLIVLGQIYQCHGAPDLAKRYYEEALALAEQVGEPQLLFPVYDGLATLHLDRGEDDQAEELLRRAQEVCERAGVEPDALMVLPFLC
jgi:adenylate cyclase